MSPFLFSASGQFVASMATTFIPSAKTAGGCATGDDHFLALDNFPPVDEGLNSLCRSSRRALARQLGQLEALRKKTLPPPAALPLASFKSICRPATSPWPFLHRRQRYRRPGGVPVSTEIASTNCSAGIRFAIGPRRQIAFVELRRARHSAADRPPCRCPAVLRSYLCSPNRRQPVDDLVPRRRVHVMSSSTSPCP